MVTRTMRMNESLEAELAALQGESHPKEKRKSEESHGILFIVMSFVSTFIQILIP